MYQSSLFYHLFLLVAQTLTESNTEYAEIRQFVRGRQVLQSQEQPTGIQPLDYEYALSTCGCDPSSQDCTLSCEQAGLSQSRCFDLELPNAVVTCATIASLGQCNVIDQQYCQASCGVCTVECEDVLFAGLLQCPTTNNEAFCNMPEIKGRYCQRSCGNCTSSQEPGQPDITNENQVVGGEWAVHWQNLTTQQPTEQSPSCIDVEIPDSVLDCNTIAQVQQCDLIQEEYCSASCGRCDIEVCEDVLFEGLTECPIINNDAFCEQLRGGQYCQKSCGYCLSSREAVSLLSPNPGSIYTSPSDGDLVVFRDPLSPSTPIPNNTSSIDVPAPVVDDIVDPPSPSSPILNDTCSKASSLTCDIEALQAFKNSLVRGQARFSSWDGDNTCTWKYVTCETVALGQQRVSQLEIEEQGNLAFSMSGTLPEDFSNLRFLTSLTIRNQNLTGPVSPSFSLMTKMKKFVLEYTELTGSIPAEFSVWAEMEEFDMSFSRFKGTIPQEFSSWKDVSLFHVNTQSLSGSLPLAYSVLRKLESVAVSNNQLTGSLPIEYSLWSRLREFVFWGNQLSGTLPRQYSNMIRLETFDIGRNQISGELYPEFSTWKFLEMLNIPEARLTGTLPAEYSVWDKMTEFILLQNDLSGTIPVEYSTFSSCQAFAFSENFLSGTLAPEWSNLRNVEIFRIYGTKIIGTLPPKYSTFSKCEYISVGGNTLTGTVPVEYSTMTAMYAFVAVQNDLSGSLPSEFSTWTNCEVINIHNNQFTGTLPIEYSTLTKMDAIIIQSNLFTGVLPVEYSTMRRLTQFLYGGNQIDSVEIPDQWSTMTDLGPTDV